jgi:hypothetical protein
MKRITMILSLLALFTVTTTTWAAVDKTAISANVDSIVEMIESGKDAKTIKAEDFSPYAFIMEESGTMLVHPSLSGVDCKEQLTPIYEALSVASADGVWVEYEWKGKVKHTYAKKTKNNLIVGSGY